MQPDIVELKGLKFEVMLSEAALKQKTKELAAAISKDYAGKGKTVAHIDNVIVLSVLTGAVMFTTDLYRQITINCQLDFIRAISYSGTESTGKVEISSPPKMPLKGKHVILVDDIADTGLTLIELIKCLAKQEPASLEVCVLIRKPKALKYDVQVKYCGFDIEPQFIVGYGLDYDELGRNLKSIYRKIK